MSTTNSTVSTGILPDQPILKSESIPPLENGDHLTRAEFERRYEAMPEGTRAELIEGIVYMSSPVRLLDHGRPHNHLNTWIGTYESATSGVIASDNATIRLAADDEPQPDALLMVEPSRGGQARIAADGYLEGAPELAAEVAYSTTSIDLHRKLRAYESHGVREYIVWRVRDGVLDWFVLQDGAFVPLAPGEDGLVRSATFPGLWLDPAALVSGNLARVLAVVQDGCGTAEHATFLAKLGSLKA